MVGFTGCFLAEVPDRCDRGVCSLEFAARLHRTRQVLSECSRVGRFCKLLTWLRCPVAHVMFASLQVAHGLSGMRVAAMQLMLAVASASRTQVALDLRIQLVGSSFRHLFVLTSLRCVRLKFLLVDSCDFRSALVVSLEWVAI